MLNKSIDFLRHLDPCLVLSLVTLIVIIPVGFVIDHLTLETRCSQSPLLYLGSNLSHDSIPLPFRWFVGNATTELRLVLSSYNATADPDSIDAYYLLLKEASNRHVSVHVITSNRDIYDRLTFCTTRTFLADESSPVYVSLGVADHRHVIYSSGLLATRICASAEFFIDFPDCASLANDVSSLYGLLEYYASKGYPDLFLRKFIPDTSFPREHRLPGDGACVIGIAPSDLAPPGRFPVVEWMQRNFTDFGSTLSLLSQALFPRAPTADADMPELLLTERIEAGALNGTAVKILVPPRVMNVSAAEVKSLLQFPGVEMQVVNTSGNASGCRLPTFYEFGNMTGFMPMPFEYLVGRNAVTFSLHLRDAQIAARLRRHFCALWAGRGEQ
jgi:hypothetical protein